MAERPPSDDDRSAPGAPSSAWTHSQDTRAQVPRSADTGFTPGTMLAGRDVLLGAAAGTAAALFFMFNIVEAPISLDIAAWSAARALPVLAVLLGLALYGFHTSLAGKPLFGRSLLED